jgi:hypothetical protein
MTVSTMIVYPAAHPAAILARNFIADHEHRVDAEHHHGDAVVPARLEGHRGAEGEPGNTHAQARAWAASTTCWASR